MRAYTQENEEDTSSSGILLKDSSPPPSQLSLDSVKMAASSDGLFPPESRCSWSSPWRGAGVNATAPKWPRGSAVVMKCRFRTEAGAPGLEVEACGLSRKRAQMLSSASAAAQHRLGPMNFPTRVLQNTTTQLRSCGNCGKAPHLREAPDGVRELATEATESARTAQGSQGLLALGLAFNCRLATTQLRSVPSCFRRASGRTAWP